MLSPAAAAARPRRPLVALLVASLLALAALPGFARPAHASTDPVALEWHYVALINKARAEDGQPPIPVYGPMRDQARSWSAQIQKDQRLYHHPDIGREASAVAPD